MVEHFGDASNVCKRVGFVLLSFPSKKKSLIRRLTDTDKYENFFSTNPFTTNRVVQTPLLFSYTFKDPLLPSLGVCQKNIFRRRVIWYYAFFTSFSYLIWKLFIWEKMNRVRFLIALLSPILQTRKPVSTIQILGGQLLIKHSILFRVGGPNLKLWHVKIDSWAVCIDILHINVRFIWPLVVHRQQCQRLNWDKIF